MTKNFSTLPTHTSTIIWHNSVNVWRGNPYDNALAEMFFPILKTEYINFYNNYHIQAKTKLTPIEKRNQFVA